MREMKDSGIEWIGEIPKDWENRPLRSIITQRDGGAWGQEPEEEGGTICLRVADFDYSKGIFKDCPETCLTLRSYTYPQIYRLKLKKNDLLIEKSGGGEKTPVGRSVIFDKNYTALFANFMDRIRINDAIVNPCFAQYWLRALYACRVTPFYINQTIGIQNIDLSYFLAKEKTFFPSLSEQRNIVEYLDRKCSEIDALFADVKEQIEILEQDKRSVISEAVTKGLNPDAEMKDSGIEWIGEIPRDWKMVRSKYNFKAHKNIVGYRVDDYERLALTMQGVIKRSKEDSTGLQPEKFETYQILEKNELVFKLIDLQNISTSRVGLSPYTGIVSPAYIIISRTGEVLPEYAEKWFLSMWQRQIFNHIGDDGVRSSLNAGDLLNVPIAVPPLDEQRAIATFLDDKCAEIDAIIADKEEQLTILDEYKKSLIYEYVTGKKEVPAA